MTISCRVKELFQQEGSATVTIDATLPEGPGRVALA